MLCRIAFYQAVDEFDDNGWSPIHHAVDSTSFSWRAGLASFALLEITKLDVHDKPTTGSRPRGFSCLHLACDGSDKCYRRADLVQALLDSNSNIEAKAANGNTPAIVASGVGVSDILQVLIDAKANVDTTNARNLTAWQSSMGSSGTVTATLAHAKATPPKNLVPSAKQRTGRSMSRTVRSTHTYVANKHARSQSSHRGWDALPSDDMSDGWENWTP
jgi:hypothetical protein